MNSSLFSRLGESCNRVEIDRRKLRYRKTPTDDRVWLVDHFIRIGKERCLAVAAARFADLPPLKWGAVGCNHGPTGITIPTSLQFIRQRIDLAVLAYEDCVLTR